MSQRRKESDPPAANPGHKAGPGAKRTPVSSRPRTARLRSGRFEFDVYAWLAAMDGFSYLTDPAGVILATNQAAAEAGRTTDEPPRVEDRTVAGRCLFDMLEGDDVVSTYRRLHEKVLTSRKRQLSFEFRCDGPEIERKMKLSIGALRQEGQILGVLYQSTLISSQQRVPLNFLSNDEALRAYRLDAGLPLVTICNFCADVVLPNTEPPLWIRPETYYYRHGPMDVRLSHGVCPTCRVLVVEPLLSD